MNLNIDYKRDAEGIKNIPNANLTQDYINFAINGTHKEGVEGQLKRVIGRLQRKIEEAVEKDETEITLEEAEKDLLKKCFDKVKVPPNILQYWIILEDEVQKL